MRSRCRSLDRPFVIAALTAAAVAPCSFAVEPERQPATDATAANVLLLRAGDRMPVPRGVDDDPFAPCTLNQLQNCQLFEYPRVAGTSQGSAGLGIDGFPNGFTAQRVCDHFRAAATGSVSSVCWWGTYGAPPGGICGDMPTDPAIDNFVITYYARANTGLPDTSAIIGGPFVQDSSTLTVSRRGLCDAGGITSAAYSATHAAVNVTSGTCYFVEIRNLTNGTQTWFWSRTSPFVDNVCFIDLTSNGYELTEQANGDRAFCVGINIDPFGQGSQACLPPTNPPPLNDSCAAAEHITGPGMTGFDNSAATISSGEGQTNAACAYAGATSAIEKDVWYDWLAAAPGFSAGDLIEVTAGTCGSGLVLDSKMAVYNAPKGGGCPSDSDLIDCIDDICDTTPVNNANIAARVTFNAVVGQHYIFQVGAAAVGQAGVQSLFVSAAAAVGRCCLSGGDCAVVTETRCAALGGTYAGDGTSCGAVYAPLTGNNAMEDIGASGTALSFVQGDDDGASATIPFAFRFYGREHTSVLVGVNGQLTFGGPLYTFANTWPIPSHPVAPNAYAAVLADDFLVPPGGGCGDIRTETRGAAPNRRFIVQWNHVCHFSSVDDNNFQVILYEGSNNIEFRYGTTNPAEITPTGGVGPAYIIGLESESGADSVVIDNGTGAVPAPGTSVTFVAGANPGGECPSDNPCPCNFNGDQNLNSQDFFDFLACFFTPGCPEADYNNSGQVNSQDFFDFLSCFFSPPKGCN
jgi:hypothetical protein